MKSIIISAIIGIMFLLFASSGANAQQYVGITPYLPAEPTNYTSSVNVSTGYFTNITNDVLTGNMSMIVDNVTGGQFEGDLLAPVVDSVGGPGNFWFFFFGIIIFTRIDNTVIIWQATLGINFIAIILFFFWTT